MSYTDNDSRLIKILALLKGEILFNEGLVKLSESLRSLIYCLRVLYNVGSSFVFKVKIGCIILLAKKVKKWLFVGRELDC